MKAALLVLVVLVVAFVVWRRARPVEPSPMMALAAFARAHSDLVEVLNHAAGTPYTALRLERIPRGDLAQADANGIPTEVLTKWMLENSRDLLLTDMAAVTAALRDYPEGEAVLARPEDNPLSDERPFLRLRFEGGKITRVYEGYLD